MTDDTRSLVVEAVIANPDRQLRPGMFVAAQLELPAQRDELFVPAGAVDRTGDAARVFVVQDDGLREQVVAVGQSVRRAGGNPFRPARRRERLLADAGRGREGSLVRRCNWLAAICIKRPVFAMVLILILAVLGIVGYTPWASTAIRRSTFPMVTVTTRLTGATAEEVETEITNKIEEAVNTVSGIEELRSVSAEGVSLVYITFVMEKDVDIAAQDVRDRVNRVLPDLPRNIDQPTVEKMDPDAMPVVTVAVSATRAAARITEYCDKVLRRRLETVAG